MKSVALNFTLGPDAAAATMRIDLAGRGAQVWPLGLDGVFRMSAGPYGLPQGARGRWEDDATFLFEYDNIGNNDHVFLRLHFTGAAVNVEAQETAHEHGVTITGTAR
jgi:hypothetical protein